LSKFLEHSLTHTGEKRISCFTCGALFTGDLKLKVILDSRKRRNCSCSFTNISDF
jgi:hypothetical protein